MNPALPELPASSWLLENGLKELEVLLRAVVYHPSAPVLITDDERNSRDASVGVGKLLGVARGKIIGRPVDDFAEPVFKPQLLQIWRDVRELGTHEGTLPLVSPDGTVRNV